MSSASPGQRFADYFAICGLDTVTGLEADQLSGELKMLAACYHSCLAPRKPRLIELH